MYMYINLLELGRYLHVGIKNVGYFIYLLITTTIYSIHRFA